MHSHKLTEVDRWFIEKGQVDTMSRTPFDIGLTVVVCDHKHVMLLDFYDGTCPTCRSTTTVPFGKSSVEYPKPPKPKEEFLKCFFPSKVARKVIPKANAGLGWTLGILIVALVVLIATGTISNALFLQRIDTLLIPRTELLISRISTFVFSASVTEKFVSSGIVISTRNGTIVANAILVLSVLGTGLWSLLKILWIGLQVPIERSRVICEHTGGRTQHLIKTMADWISGLFNRFS